MTEGVRLLNRDDLEDLIALYRYLHPDDAVPGVNQRLRDCWEEILADPNLYYFGIEAGGTLVSSCNLAIIKNLTRSARSYALIENIVTHPDYRQRGYGTAVLKQAVQTAREQNGYKVMLMTGRKDESILRFYEKAGFDRGEKTAFIIRWDDSC